MLCHSLCTLGEGRTKIGCKADGVIPSSGRLDFSISRCPYTRGWRVRAEEPCSVARVDLQRSVAPVPGSLAIRSALVGLDRYPRVAKVRNPGVLRKASIWYRMSVDLSLPPYGLAEKPGCCRVVACACLSHRPSCPNEVYRAKS